MNWSRQPKMLFVWMVALSLIGEFVGDAGVFVLSGHLQIINYGEVAALNNEAGNARLDAGSANKEAGLARKDASAANKDAGEAKERAGKLEMQAATLRKQAEDERTARVTLEEGIAWRRLTKDERDAIGRNLRGLSGQIARFMYHVNDVEFFHFATDVANALHDAGWNVNEPQPVLVMAEGPVALGTNPSLATGIRVISTSDDASRRASVAFIDEFNKRGFDSNMSDPDIRPNVRVITLWFEPRPEGPQGNANVAKLAHRPQ